MFERIRRRFRRTGFAWKPALEHSATQTRAMLRVYEQA
jgi:hypothetical protein